MNNYVDISANRIARIIDDHADYENVADIIADVMHYCQRYEIPFEVALNRAQGYVDAELKEENDIVG